MARISHGAALDVNHRATALVEHDVTAMSVKTFLFAFISVSERKNSGFEICPLASGFGNHS